MEHYIDIIFFAILAGFLFFKLRQVLGEYNEEDKPGSKPSQDQGLAKNKPQDTQKSTPVSGYVSSLQLRSITASRSVADAVKQVMTRHESFDPGHFLDGAKRAFDMIVNAYTSGNKDLLKKLLTPELYQAYAKDIDEREKEGKVLEIVVHSLKDTIISDVDVRENVTRIYVTYKAEETTYLRDRNGEIIEGNPSERDHVTDIWMFEQNLNNDDPTWYLAQTQTDETYSQL